MGRNWKKGNAAGRIDYAKAGVVQVMCMREASGIGVNEMKEGEDGSQPG